MNDIPKDIDQQLAQLVISLQMGAMQQMGKVASPVTGKVERDLTIAQATIDLIAMLERKMTGNLSDEEKKLISHVKKTTRPAVRKNRRKNRTGKT